MRNRYCETAVELMVKTSPMMSAALVCVSRLLILTYMTCSHEFLYQLFVKAR